MALLDTFSFMFEGDTGTLEQGVDKSRRSSDELVESLKDADNQANKAGSSFASMAARAVGALAAAAGIGKTISSTIARASDVHLMNQTAESIGVAVEEMDAFRRSVEDSGGTAAGAQDTMVRMAESIGQAMMKADSEQGKLFKSMGINLHDAQGQAINASDALLQVSESIQDMDAAQARFTLKQLQITDPKTVEMLLKGRQEVEAMTRAHKEQGVVTKEMAEQAARLDTAMNKMRGGMDRARLGLMEALLPAIIKGVEWLTKIVDWARENGQVLGAFFTIIAGVVTAVYLPAMIKAAAATLAATWPLLLIIGIVAAVAAAFALAYDDVMNFIQGNDSLIGQIFDKYPLVEAIFKRIGEAIRLMGAIGGIVFDNMVSGVNIMVGAFTVLKDALVAIFEFIGAAFRMQFDFIMSGIDRVKSGIATVGGWFGIGGGSDEVEEGQGQVRRTAAAVEEGQAQVSSAAANPLNSTTSSAISNSRSSNENNVQIGELTIETQATDADGISRDISGSLEDQLAQLDADFSTGVAR